MIIIWLLAMLPALVSYGIPYWMTARTPDYGTLKGTLAFLAAIFLFVEFVLLIQAVPIIFIGYFYLSGLLAGAVIGHVTLKRKAGGVPSFRPTKLQMWGLALWLVPAMMTFLAFPGRL